MLFRTHDGKLININKYDFKTDTGFYRKILDIKEPWMNANTKIGSSSSNYSSQAIARLFK